MFYNEWLEQIDLNSENVTVYIYIENETDTDATKATHVLWWIPWYILAVVLKMVTDKQILKPNTNRGYIMFSNSVRIYTNEVD